MQEESKNTPDIDLSDVFSTYKSHPLESEDIKIGDIDKNPPSRPSSLIEEKEEKHSMSTLQIIVDGFVRVAKSAVWGMAVLGGLFIAALATNTIDKAIHLINANLGTNISLSGEVNVVSPIPEVTPGLTSDTLSTKSSNNTPDTVASKRRAILEAKKAAKILEEHQKALEQLSQ